MSKTGTQQANGEAIAFPPRQTEQAQSIAAVCAALRQQLQDTKEEIRQRQREIKHNKEYIAQRQLPLLKNELKELQAMAESLPPGDPLQEKISDQIRINETLIEQISETPNALKDVEEATSKLEQILYTLQQELEAKKTELQLLNLNGANVHTPWLFFQEASFGENGDEEDEPTPTTFRTLNRSYNDRN